VARSGEGARFRSAGGAASYRKTTITRCRRALCGPNGRRRPIPFGRRSGLLQKSLHCPLQEGPLWPERAKAPDSVRPAERPPTEKPPLPAVGGPLRPDQAKPPATIRHRRRPSRSLSRGAEDNRSRDSIPAPPIKAKSQPNAPPAFRERFCLLLPRLAKVTRPQARSAGRNGFGTVRRGFHVSRFRFHENRAG
jgi:hypothetical protein